MNSNYQIIVVGGGHAGSEAALIAARMGVPTLLVTGLKDAIARMPCNPSIGGLAKSHLVFELDALGGEMGYNADMTALQEKTLNLSRGPAVHATRAQCAKKEYSRRMQRVVECQNNLKVIEDVVTSLITSDKSGCMRVDGVSTESHGEFKAPFVILTSGTSLRGRIFIGNEISESGGDHRRIKPSAADTRHFVNQQCALDFLPVAVLNLRFDHHSPHIVNAAACMDRNHTQFLELHKDTVGEVIIKFLIVFKLVRHFSENIPQTAELSRNNGAYLIDPLGCRL